jgi:putative protein kinase ArgK-like GTPase of G3E family
MNESVKHCAGITGTGGSGKSSLVDELVVVLIFQKKQSD